MRSSRSIKLSLKLASSVALLSLLFVCSSARDAHAQTLGVDLEGVTPVGSTPGYSTTGEGIAARLGYRLGLPLISLTPEIGYSYVHFGADSNNPQFDINRLFAGARVGFGGIIVPSLYAHIGYGFTGTTNSAVNPDNGVALDAGVALDIRIVPHFGFGIHGGYATVASSPKSIDWVNYGVQADVYF